MFCTCEYMIYLEVRIPYRNCNVDTIVVDIPIRGQYTEIIIKLITHSYSYLVMDYDHCMMVSFVPALKYIYDILVQSELSRTDRSFRRYFFCSSTSIPSNCMTLVGWLSTPVSVIEYRYRIMLHWGDGVLKWNSWTAFWGNHVRLIFMRTSRAAPTMQHHNLKEDVWEMNTLSFSSGSVQI